MFENPAVVTMPYDLHPGIFPCVVYLTNRRQFSMVYTLIDHKMTS